MLGTFSPKVKEIHVSTALSVNKVIGHHLYQIIPSLKVPPKDPSPYLRGILVQHLINLKQLCFYLKFHINLKYG